VPKYISGRLRGSGRHGSRSSAPEMVVIHFERFEIRVSECGTVVR
jgi:hypothetical protein